jgi:hypothetical protein
MGHPKSSEPSIFAIQAVYSFESQSMVNLAQHAKESNHRAIMHP